MARTSTQWVFDYEDLSRLTELSHDSIRQAKSRGDFNPEILGSVISWVARHGTIDTRRLIMEALLVRQLPRTRATGKSDDADQPVAPRLVPSPLEASPKKKSAKKSRARP